MTEDLEDKLLVGKLYGEELGVGQKDREISVRRMSDFVGVNPIQNSLNILKYLRHRLRAIKIRLILKIQLQPPKFLIKTISRLFDFGEVV